jgi:hypothetical protein
LASGWTNNLVLNRGSTRVNVYPSSTGGTALTFNGVDNVFPNTTLPKSLWVEGATPSDSTNDVEFTLFPQGLAPCNASDRVRFTVLWVSVTGKFANTDHISSDNAAGVGYLIITAPSRDTLGAGQYVDRMGWGCEFIGTVAPTNFSGAVQLFRDGEAKPYVGQGGSTLVTNEVLTFRYPNVPPGSDDSDISARDDDPQSGGSAGKVYDYDAPGTATDYPDPPNEIRRLRANFKAFAGFGGVRCSSFYNWYCKASYKKSGPSASGTVTSAGTNTLVDTSQSWTPGQWKDGTVVIESSAGDSQYRVIFGNGTNSITITDFWNPIPDTNYTYIITGTNTWTQTDDVSGDNLTGPGGPVPLTWDLQ